ncbi:MAG: sulfide/dihydroorotate dehydrogenase-like FAD/NAD-binding protein [Lachnospiraceae bacterium]|nr:sulfide/dihydroorotate dehydrogenase-like FAD/NAD-binding protein [Lachnospiraceae bacterium]
MFKIIEKEWLNANTFRMVVDAPMVSRSCMPGQFVIVRTDEEGERIPLTICDYDRDAHTVTIVVQTIGAGTIEMSKKEAGEYLADFVGPLGNPSDLCTDPIEEVRKKKIVFVAGGLGTAPVYCQVKWLHEHGITADVIVGARSKDILILEDEMKAVGNLYITTDDGSYGRTGNVTVCMEDLVTKEGKEYDHCVCIGPMIMMKFLSLLTKKLNIHTVVSMNPIMVDGTGMCGACRVKVGNDTKFACVHGPEFDAEKIDWDEAMRRSAMYKPEEAAALEKAKEGV